MVKDPIPNDLIDELMRVVKRASEHFDNCKCFKFIGSGYNLKTGVYDLQYRLDDAWDISILVKRHEAKKPRKTLKKPLR